MNCAPLFVVGDEGSTSHREPITKLADSEEYDAFFSRCKLYADWMAEDLPTFPAMLLTLSTCEYSKKNSRLVVVCACTDD